jgi:nucleoside-diphosphate-sugar epimerase
VRNSSLDPALARHELGWEARVGMADGIERTLRWVRAR